MFRILKWLGFVVCAALLLTFVVFGTNAPSYIKTAIGSARKKVKEAIPIDFEIQRAERLVKEIEPQIRGCIRDVALGEVELSELRESISSLRKRELGLKERLMKRKSMLESDQCVFYIAGIRMERKRLEMDLERIFDEYKTVKSLISGKEKLLRSQERALNAARRKLEAVLAERTRLREMLKSLKAQKRQVDALAAQSRKFDLDDSSLVQAREALKEVKKRLDVAQRMLEADLLDLVDTAGTEQEGDYKDILSEVNRFLERENGHKKKGRVTAVIPDLREK